LTKRTFVILTLLRKILYLDLVLSW